MILTRKHSQAPCQARSALPTLDVHFAILDARKLADDPEHQIQLESELDA
jgi:hypothetical protein